MTFQTHGQAGVWVFVFNCVAHYSNCHFVIANKIDRLKVKDCNAM